MGKKNLMPIQEVNSMRTREQHSADSRKAGIASGKARKEKKLWKDEIIKRLNAKDWEEIMDTLINNAKNNGGKDFEILRDTMGQKPIDKQEVENVQRVNIIDDTEEDNGD